VALAAMVDYTDRATMTHIRAARYVECPFSAALEFAEKAVRGRPGFYLTPSPPLGEKVMVSAKSADDSSDDARKHDALLIAWRPQTRGMFPDFHGALTVRPELRGALLQLNGRYEPPFGFAGKLFDVIVGRSIARSTLANLLSDLALDIEAQYQEERRQNKTAS